MHHTRSLFLACLAGALPALAQNDTTSSSSDPNTGSGECQTYHGFIFRGSNETYPGRAGPMIESICESLDGDCDYEDIVYPATLSVAAGGPAGSAYCASMTAGGRNGQKQMRAYADKCPDAQLIMIGYSQGATVVLDVLGGGGADWEEIYGCEQAETPALNPTEAPGSNIAAAIAFGATRYTGNQTFNYGTGAAYDGVLPRSGQQLGDLQRYAPVLRAWCHYGDPLCASASEVDIQQHLNYFEEHTGEGADWVVATARNETAREAVGAGNVSAGNGTRAGNATVSGNATASGSGPRPSATGGSGASGNGGSSDEQEDGGDGQDASGENAASAIAFGSLPTAALVTLAMLALGW